MTASLKQRVIAFLRWSERYTKTDMLYLASGGFWSVIGQVAASLTALCLAIVMARFVPKDLYGDYKYILAIVSILATFSLTGIGTSVFQSIARGYRSSLADGFAENIRWSIFVFLGAFALGAYYLYKGNSMFGIGILIGGCITPFLSGFNLYSSLFAGEKDFGRLTWYGSVVTNVVPAIAVGAVAMIAPQPLFLLLAYFIANTAAAACAYWRGTLRYPDLSKTKDPGMATYGKHLSAMNILVGIANNIDQVLLFHFVGPIQLAVYNFATAIPDQFKGPWKSLDIMIQARFTNRTDRDIRTTMSNKVVWLFLASIAFIGFYWLIAPFLYRLLFPQYVDAIFFSQLYALGTITFALTPTNSYLLAKRKVGAQYIFNIGASFFQIGALAVGVLTAGLLGIIVARIASRLVSVSLSYLLYRHSVHTAA